MSVRLSRLASLTAAGALGLALTVGVQASETYTATAEVLTPQNAVESSTPVTLSIERFSSETEREQVMAAIKSGGTAALRGVLARLPAIGSLRVGSSTTPIKYAYARSSLGGLVTVAAASPIVMRAGGAANGSGIGLAFIDTGAAKGELVPDTEVKLDEQGALVTAAASTVRVRLANVVKK